MFNDVCIVSVRQSKIVYQAPHKVVCQHGDWMATSLPQGFVWVCIVSHTHFVTLKGRIFQQFNGKCSIFIIGPDNYVPIQPAILPFLV